MRSFQKKSFKKKSFKMGEKVNGGEDSLNSSNNGGEEYVVEEFRDRMGSSRGSRFTLIENELGLDPTHRRFSRQSIINGLKHLSQGLFIHPDNRWYKAWEKFMLVWAIYSSFFTPMEFGFFRGLPKNLFILDIAGQVAFLLDIFLQFFVAYRESHSHKMVYKRNPIALRYLKSHFITDLLACMPWDIIYKACGRKEEVRYLLWIRLTRVRKVTNFFQRMEKDIRINYLFTRIVKLISVELYCMHTAACIFYYFATTLPEEKEGYTWIGSLKLGDYSYSHFREIDIWRRYTTSLYFAIVTMATVGYGEIHAVNLREMIFIMIYVSFDMILVAYLISNMIALIVKGSKTVRYGDKMTDLTKYMNINRLGRDLCNQIKGHLHLQHESSYTDSAVLQDIPMSIRAKGKKSNLGVKQLKSDITFHASKQEADLALRVNSAAFYGDLYQLKGLIRSGADPNKKDYDGRTALHLAASRGYEDITLYLIQERVDINVEDNFGNTPLLEAIKSGHDSVASLLTKEGALLKIDNPGIFLCTVVARGDSDFLRRLLSNGIDPNSVDYDHRTPLHVAASQGLYLMAKLLVEAGASVFSKDRWGNTPMDEGRMCEDKKLIRLLVEAKKAQLSKFPNHSEHVTDMNTHRQKKIQPVNEKIRKNQEEGRKGSKTSNGKRKV